MIFILFSARSSALRLGGNTTVADPDEANDDDELDNSKKRKRFQSAFKVPSSKRPPSYDSTKDEPERGQAGLMWRDEDDDYLPTDED